MEMTKHSPPSMGEDNRDEAAAYGFKGGHCSIPDHHSGQEGTTQQHPEHMDINQEDADISKDLRSSQHR